MVAAAAARHARIRQFVDKTKRGAGVRGRQKIATPKAINATYSFIQSRFIWCIQVFVFAIEGVAKIIAPRIEYRYACGCIRRSAFLARVILNWRGERASKRSRCYYRPTSEPSAADYVPGEP